MMSKTKVFIMTGPIAAGKTFLATACAGSGMVSYLNFDACCYRGGVILSTNDVINNVVKCIKQIEQNGEAGTIVIDGWFSFSLSWWEKSASYESISELDVKLNFLYEIIPVIIFRQPKVLMSDIQSNPAKYKYSNYQDHLEKIYDFLINSIFGWWKNDGKSETIIIPK